MHENLSGKGVIRAKFLPAAQYYAYRALQEALPNSDQAEELLAHNRATIGAMVMASSREIFEGELAPGTRTLIWSGGDRNIPPAVHDIVRDQPGEYRILARQIYGDLGQDFIPIE
jgi:hypothetical protein